ncbi:MAG: trigger factor [bacterium]
MKVDIAEKNSFTRELTVEIPAEEMEKEFNKNLSKYRRELQIPGFRPGKVPMNYVMSRFGKAIRGEVVEKAIEENYKKALDENKIIPVNQAKIEDIKAEENSPLVFKAVVEIEPDIELKDYKGLGIRPEVKQITDKEINEVLESIRDNLAKKVPVERSIKNGDLVELDYKKVIFDGEEQKEYENPKEALEIGKSQTRDFDKELIGLNSGEEKAITVDFPEDYANKKLAGKKAEFLVYIKSIKEKVLPKLDDELAKDTGNYKSLDELKAKIKADLEDEEQKKAFKEAGDKVIDAIIEKNSFDVPESMVENYLSYKIQELTEVYNLEIKDDEFKKRFQPDAVKFLKRKRILREISKAESIKPSQDEVDAEIKKVADMQMADFTRVKEQMRKNGLTIGIREDIKEKKTLEFLFSS